MNIFDILRENINKKKDYFQKFYETEGRTEADEYLNKATQLAFDDAVEIINQAEKEYNNGWVPSEESPKDDKPVLLSIANFSVPLVGRYEEDDEGGAYYVGDEDESLVSQGMIVNAWQPLPEPYRGEGYSKVQTNADRIRSMSDEELAKLITSGELCAICPFCEYYNTELCYLIKDGEHKNCDTGIIGWLKKEVEE